MQRKITKHRGFLLALLLCLAATQTAWYFGDDRALHVQIKMAVYQQEWDRAVQFCEKLVKEYPLSIYCDDAMYWIGFSLEQNSDDHGKIFQAYQNLVDKYPESNWVDDAIIHQIVLAKKMIMLGKETYKPFLMRQLEESDSTIRYQAALALGELRDNAALPVLEEMAKHDDEDIVRMSMEILGRYSRRLESTETVSQSVQPSGDGSESDMHATMPAVVFKGLRREQGLWTEEKLLLNGLYHIAPLREVAFYLMLEHDWDKKEWWRKFWAPRDPTPTTPENEAEALFRKRVRYAYEHFGRDWEKQNVYYPPWDARGELYIRFGKPDRREEDKKEWEEWTYYRYKVNFKVSSMHHNADGKAIELAAVSRYLYRNNMRGQELLMRKPDFHYADPQVERIENMKSLDFRLKSGKRIKELMQITFLYRMPLSNLKLKETGKRLSGGYLCRWVVYDEDYLVVVSDQFKREITLEDKRQYSRGTVTGDITVKLMPGSYKIALRFEDLGSNRTGIYKKGFTIKPKSDWIETEDNNKPGPLGMVFKRFRNRSAGLKKVTEKKLTLHSFYN